MRRVEIRQSPNEAITYIVNFGIDDGEGGVDSTIYHGGEAAKDEKPHLWLVETQHLHEYVRLLLYDLPKRK